MRARMMRAMMRLSTVAAGAMLLGEGCIGPKDLRSGFVNSFNALVFRAIELWLASLLGIPPEQLG